MMIKAVGDRRPSLFEIDPIDLASKEVDTAQHLADWIHDRREVQVAGRHFMQHGREQEKILPIDQSNLNGGIPAQVSSPTPWRR